MNEYKLPDVGEGLTEAEIVSWRVKVGDTIKVNDIVCEIETAKSLVELPSPYAGTITALLVREGETVAVGTPIISISDGADAVGPAAASPPEIGTPRDDEPVEPGVQGSPARTPNLVGYGPRTTQAKRRPRTGAATPSSKAGTAAQEMLHDTFSPGPARQPAPEVEELPVPARPPEPSTVGERSGAAKVLAKPPVRKLARDLGVDLATVTPTGPHGTISRSDVMALAGASATASAPTEVSVPSYDRTAGERETRVPIKGVRKMTAQAMVGSAFTAPHVTEWITVDVTATIRYVDKLKAHRDFREVKVSPLLLVAKAVCLAMRRTPEVNASWDEAAQEIVLKHYVNLGIAAATPRGLVVPNVKNADQMSLSELAAALNGLTRTAKEGKTQPADMSGGSFTITNVGVFGVDAGTPILNPGEAGILCFGAVRQQPWVHEGQIEVRWITTLALSFDHRLVDGEQGSRFLADVAAILEDPADALLY